MIPEKIEPTLHHFQKALALTQNGLLLQDMEGNPLYANQALCQMFGASKEEILKEGLPRLFPSESLAHIRERILPELLRMGVGKSELEGLNKEGKPFPLSISITTVSENGSGTVSGYVSLCHDLSEELALRQRRLHSEKLAAIGEMLAGVAHELNNPLTSVVGFSELLLRKRVSSDIKRQLRRIASEAIRTAKIVQNLLSVVRSHKPEKILVGINGVIQNVLELKSRQLRVDNIRIVKRLADDASLPKVVGDYQQLLEVILNLVNNAHQAMTSHRGKGTLMVKTESKNGTVIIRLSDTGPGIPKEAQAKLFQPFFTTKAEGCGLGLNICQKTIKEHGGNITLESKRQEGCTFVICLPVAADQIKPKEIERPSETLKEPLEIMVLDDEEIILDLQYHLLTQLGHHPILFKSVNEALPALDRMRFDLILADIKMPGMNGRKFYDYLKKHHPSLTERTIFVTGDILNDATRRFLEKEEVRVLYKPFVLKQLEETIESFVTNQ